MPRPAREPFRTLGLAAVDWIEHYLVHGPGDIEGTPIVMDDEFAGFVLRAYEVDKAGRRRVRRAVLSRPKGRAKSELAAMLACFEALGPARFDHWAAAGEVSPWGYAYEAGDPVGRRVTRPEVLCVATAEDQAGNTYDGVRFMLDPETCSAALAEDFGRVDVGITRTNVPGGGVIEPVTSKDATRDGAKSTFIVADESHLWVLPRLKRMHQVMVRNLLKRKASSGWMLETTTMYAPDEGSVAEGTHAYHQQVAEGRVGDRSLLFDHRQASAKWDPMLKRDRLAGLREVYGPAAKWMDLAAIAASYDDPQTSPAEWERYWFNRPVSLQGSWLPQRAWDECHARREVPDGARVVLGLDGSFNGDCTALAVVEVGEFPHVGVAGLWERPNAGTDWQVPILDVENAIRDCFLRWEVVEVVCDPFRWARTIQLLRDEGLPMEEFPQSAARMTPATQRFSDLVNNRGLTHDGSPALTRHVGNAVLKRDSRGVRLYKESKHSARKIDLAVAAVMAVERAAWWQSEGQPAEPSVWVL